MKRINNNNNFCHQMGCDLYKMFQMKRVAKCSRAPATSQDHVARNDVKRKMMKNAYSLARLLATDQKLIHIHS